MLNFVKIRSVVAELLHVDGWTGGQTGRQTDGRTNYEVYSHFLRFIERT